MPGPAEKFAMAFDQNPNGPVVNFRKWTTKVNVGIIVGVVLFLAAGALAATYWAWTSSPGEPRSTLPPSEKISPKP